MVASGDVDNPHTCNPEGALPSFNTGSVQLKLTVSEPLRMAEFVDSVGPEIVGAVRSTANSFVLNVAQLLTPLLGL